MIKTLAIKITAGYLLEISFFLSVESVILPNLNFTVIFLKTDYLVFFFTLVTMKYSTLLFKKHGEIIGLKNS